MVAHITGNAAKSGSATIIETPLAECAAGEIEIIGAGLPLIAVQQNASACLEALLPKGADTDAKDNDGEPAMLRY